MYNLIEIGVMYILLNFTCTESFKYNKSFIKVCTFHIHLMKLVTLKSYMAYVNPFRPEFET